MPGVQFLNLSDLDHMQPKAQKIKKKKEKPKEFHQLDIKKIPAPHKIKARLDEYVVGQEKAKKAMAVAFIIIINGLRQIQWTISRLKSRICL